VEKAGEISCLTDLIKIAYVARDIIGDELWWRGQSLADWKLLPGIFRGKWDRRIESSITNRFKLHSPSRYSKCPHNDDPAGWLFLMQHYRLPTRLLDWTESILIATYFAVEKDFKKPGAIWAISPTRLNENQSNEIGILTTSHSNVNKIIGMSFRKDISDINKVHAIMSSEIDLRMMMQYSQFTVHGYNRPIEDIENANQFLMKFEIPDSAKENLRQDLFLFGIRRSNLFPDLENLASELSEINWISAPSQYK